MRSEETDTMTKGSGSNAEMKIKTKSDKQAMGKTLHDVLVLAQDGHRLTCGLYESGMVLETNPDSVMMCVLPMDKSDDVTLDIHYTLIEAFCLENDIRIVKVDSSDKLASLLGGHCEEKGEPERHLLDGNDNEFYLDGSTSSWLEGSTDFNCVLIEYPPEKNSEQEAELLEYHKRTCELIPQPVIDLDI